MDLFIGKDIAFSIRLLRAKCMTQSVPTTVLRRSMSMRLYPNAPALMTTLPWCVTAFICGLTYSTPWL
jgi:hypothetical protein